MTVLIDNRNLPTEFVRRMARLCGEAWQADLAAPPHRGLRVNTLLCDREAFLSQTSFALSPVPFAPAGFELLGDEKAGTDPLHHAGAYYMQEPSAMSAVTALAPKPYEKVLDLCAAPGGKSTQIAAALGGTGLLWCNEYVRTRTAPLLQNLERCGVTNAVVTGVDSAVLAKALPAFFDAVLVDAPCSGEGMFRKETAALDGWSLDNIRLCATRGAAILDAAAAMLRPGGRLLFSTCTFAPEENECQVAAFLHRHPDFELLPLSHLPFGQPAFGWEAVASFAENAATPTADLTKARRIFPKHGGEGHFLALLSRSGGEEPTPLRGYAYPAPDKETRELIAALADWITEMPSGIPARFGDRWQWLPEGLPATKNLPILHAGLSVATVCTRRLEPTHSLYAALGHRATRQIALSPEDSRLRAFLKGEPIAAPDAPVGFTGVTVNSVPLGFGKVSGGCLKNHYPKGLRLLK